MATKLTDHAFTHGYIRPVFHPRLQTEIQGQTAVRYLRFGHEVALDRLELARTVWGRWTPAVPTHPAHLIVSTLDRSTGRWRIVREVDLPPDPRIAGQGLDQSMTAEEMDAILAAARDAPPAVIAMDGLRTDHLRVECDREHPVWPNHGECNGSPYSVPFGILHGLSAYGEPVGPDPGAPAYRPLLRCGEIRPEAPAGMRLTTYPDSVRFESEWLAVGFSLRRPMLLHLGWDALGEGQAANSRLLAGGSHIQSETRVGMAGPLLRTLHEDFGARRWTGRVEVHGNRVCYRDLECGQGVHIDAAFTVERDRIHVALVQRCEAPMPVLESETWRLAWDLTRGSTAPAAEPTRAPGRNGAVHLPMLWASDGVGCLSCRREEGDPDTWLQVETFRIGKATAGGFVLAPRPDPDACLVLPAGERRAAYTLTVTNLEPVGGADDRPMSAGLRRHWGTVFACFRPEHGGFSNNAASTNCHLSQAAPIEIVAHTRRPAEGPDPIALGRFTVERALLDGGGYGYWRNLYLDSDPVLLGAAGRLHQAARDVGWLRRIEPGLREALDRMLAARDVAGLIVCRDLSGNAGSYRWSCNSMDVVGFGHLDAYVNALAYRAFRSATALLYDLGDDAGASRCRDAADRIHAAYAGAFLNPETGWVAGWRSRDGQLHDYGFTWVNGVATAFGLLDDTVAREALERLERLREELGMGSARLGLPLNLLPIRPEDHVLPRILGGEEPTFEMYTDGSLAGWGATYYLRALSSYGLRDRARKLAAELAEGYAQGVFNGGIGTGHEFRSWEGVPTGYEGTLIGCFGPMYALAIEEGALTPPEPEWWPAAGYRVSGVGCRKTE